MPILALADLLNEFRNTRDINLTPKNTVQFVYRAAARGQGVPRPRPRPRGPGWGAEAKGRGAGRGGGRGEMILGGPGRYLKSFLESVHFFWIPQGPVASHGDPIHGQK